MTTNDPRPNYDINPSQRTACTLVLDASYSMSGLPIEQLNEGVSLLARELKNDPTASARVQLSIVCVGGPAGGASVIQDWTDAIDFTAFTLEAGGSTPFGAGMKLALDLITGQEKVYRKKGVSFTRPWIIALSDGEPTDDWKDAARRCREAESNNEVLVFPIGVEGANLSILSEFSNRGAKQLDGLKFPELFQWLSVSLSSVSRAAPGEAVQLPPDDPWAVIPS